MTLGAANVFVLAERFGMSRVERKIKTGWSGNFEFVGRFNFP